MRLHGLVFRTCTTIDVEVDTVIAVDQEESHCFKKEHVRLQ